MRFTKAAKKLSLGTSLLLALSGNGYARETGEAKPENNGNQTEEIVAGRLGKMQETLSKQLECLYDINKRLEEVEENTSSIENKVNDMKSAVRKTPWHSGPVAFGASILLGIGGLSLFDVYRRRRTTNAYNKAGEDYFSNDQFDLSMLSFESALGIDPYNSVARYNLIDALIHEENNILQNASNKKDNQEELSQISKRIAVEIKMSKEHRKKAFEPYMFEGIMSHLKADRENDKKKRDVLYNESHERYRQAVEIFTASPGKYWKRISAGVLKRRYTKLNKLYRRIGKIEIEFGDIDKTILALETALLYNLDDKESLELLHNCYEKIGKK